MQDQINYADLIDTAMRGVVREVLKRIQKTGLPAEHHFYITFRTTAPGVKISDALKARYPSEMTVVLQHQFWDFKVEENQFQVTLSFGGVPEKLVIPYASMIAFADPSIKFGLQFQQASTAANEEIQSPLTYENEAVVDDAEGALAEGAEIISLDAFRKK